MQQRLALASEDMFWWTDGKPDLNRQLVKNIEYAKWYDSLKYDEVPRKR